MVNQKQLFLLLSVFSFCSSKVHYAITGGDVCRDNSDCFAGKCEGGSCVCDIGYTCGSCDQLCEGDWDQNNCLNKCAQKAIRVASNSPSPSNSPSAGSDVARACAKVILCDRKSSVKVAEEKQLSSCASCAVGFCQSNTNSTCYSASATTATCPANTTLCTVPSPSPSPSASVSPSSSVILDACDCWHARIVCTEASNPKSVAGLMANCSADLTKNECPYCYANKTKSSWNFPIPKKYIPYIAVAGALVLCCCIGSCGCRDRTPPKETKQSQSKPQYHSRSTLGLKGDVDMNVKGFPIPSPNSRPIVSPMGFDQDPDRRPSPPRQGHISRTIFTQQPFETYPNPRHMESDPWEVAPSPHDPRMYATQPHARPQQSFHHMNDRMMPPHMPPPQYMQPQHQHMPPQHMPPQHMPPPQQNMMRYSQQMPPNHMMQHSQMDMRRSYPNPPPYSAPGQPHAYPY